MGIIKSTVYECDRCFRRASTSDFSEGSNSGEGKLTLKGHRGNRSFQGDWGGSNFDIDMLLCFSCCDDLIKILRSCKSRSPSDINEDDQKGF